MFTLIKNLYYESNFIYGARRIYEILKSRGYKVSYHYVRDICKANNFISITHGRPSKPKPIKFYTKVNRPKSIGYQFPRHLNEVWVCDYTRFYAGETIVYLFAIMDLFSRRIVAYTYNYEDETTESVIESVKAAITTRNLGDSLTIHADNEDIFKTEELDDITNRFNIKFSFNRHLSDNNYMESFFATFSKEFNFDNLTTDNINYRLKKYFNFYNNKRLHSSLGYLSPRMYESSIITYIPVKYRRDILHVDINACFAQYECILNPKLRGKNLVVVGEEYKRDKIIVCASYPVRKYGIDCGDNLRYAKFKCPELVVRTSRKKVYEKLSKKFFDILYRYSDMVEPYGIDEAWVDVTNSHMLFGSNLDIANKIMADLKNEMGITVSIGISFNKIYSKLASDMHKPNKITFIPYKYYKKIVFGENVDKLLYVGSKTSDMFHFYGVNTIGDLAYANHSVIKEIVGDKNAHKLIRYASGLEDSRVRYYGEVIEPKSFSRAETLDKNAHKFNEIKKMIYLLCEDVCIKLRNNKKLAYGICLKIRDKKYKDHSMQETLSIGINNNIEMAERIEWLIYKKLGYDNNNLMSLKDYIEIGNLPFDVRQISVTAFNIKDSDEIKTIDKCIDKINHKYDGKIIRYGCLCEPWYYRYIK